jgi:hypothetical protein
MFSELSTERLAVICLTADSVLVLTNGWFLVDASCSSPLVRLPLEDSVAGPSSVQVFFIISKGNETNSHIEHKRFYAIQQPLKELACGTATTCR